MHNAGPARTCRRAARHARSMTTNSHSDLDPHELRIQDPAEELAASALLMGRAPRDCLLLIESSGGEEHLLSCTPLTELWAPGGREALEAHLGSFRERGGICALALIVLGDGYEQVGEESVEEVAGMGAGQVLSAARLLLPEPFPIDGVWTIGGGRARLSVLRSLDSAGIELLVSPPVRLAPQEETRTAARAVLEGIPLPRSEAERIGRLALIADASADLAELEGGRTAATHSPAEAVTPALPVLGEAAAALARERWRSGAGLLEGTAASVLEALRAAAAENGAWDLLLACASRSGGDVSCADRVLPSLAEDPALAPGEELRPGGSWMLALEELVEVAELWEGAPSGAHRALRALLAMLAWWNLCGATAGVHIDMMLLEDPDDALGHLLAALLRSGITPAWADASGSGTYAGS